MWTKTHIQLARIFHCESAKEKNARSNSQFDQVVSRLVELSITDGMAITNMNQRASLNRTK